MLRIGILTPRSTLYPTMTFDILNGLKAGLAHCGIADSTNLFTDNIGFGTDEAEIYTKAEKMLLDNNADVVIACCDSRIAAMLQPMFTAAGKLLLVTNPGANLPEGWQPQPTTIVHSLNFCFCTALTGAMAAANGKTAAMTTAYYDAGYNQVYTMVSRFQQLGGSILHNHVTHLLAEQFTLAPLQQFVATQETPSNLLCLYSADMAALFYKEMAAIQQQHTCTIFAAPMLLEESLAKELNNDVLLTNVRGYTPWLSTLSNTNNQQFVTAFETAQGKRPNIFALLGWEAALLIDSFNKQLTANNNNTAAAVQAMGTASPLPSPRGWIKLDPASNHIYGPVWLVKGSGFFELLSEENHSLDMDAEWKDFTATISLNANEINSAWRNTYLCI
jgi:branched-chain amino acid transport system substrate-binding protein